ncbi:hypothetical protein B0H67DRAFT_558325 [Lasiosphaeris hirsuta]|uniref:Uncharacterized protein n=1 Tax=Lasiosphaeris hirsuta TaxID=260670 RepID=A0AA40DIL5_9PEZI|nr:hypothetical protein B0H67DRAFT_558325 [Lasiosphaeris hirsuta]
MDPTPEGGIRHPEHIVKLAELSTQVEVSSTKPLPYEDDNIDRVTRLSTSGSFVDLVIHHPEVFALRTTGRDRVKLRGKICAKEPAFRWWLASGNTDWHQETQLTTMPMQDCELGDPAFAEWMLTPFPDVESGIVSALVSGTTACFRAIAVCTCCAQEDPIDNFIMACTTSPNQGVPVCGNCVYKDMASTCDVEIPTPVCLMAECKEQVSGCEHVISPLIDRSFLHSEYPAVQALLAIPPVATIYLKASFYARLLTKLATREPVEQRVLDALLVASRDKAGNLVGEWCQHCIDINNQGPADELVLPFSYCATSTRADFCGGKCNNCIAEGRDCTFRSSSQDDDTDTEGTARESEVGAVSRFRTIYPHSPAYLPLAYPLMFPTGDEGFHWVFHPRRGAELPVNLKHQETHKRMLLRLLRGGGGDGVDDVAAAAAAAMDEGDDEEVAEGPTALGR